MIIAISGEVIHKEPTQIYLKTAAGLTYALRISLHCSAELEEKFVSLHTTLLIKEDSHTLFGFIDRLEKELFDRLLKINGVGPSTALAICSTFTPQSFSKAVLNQDVNAIKSVPGIGPKSAKRILVELGDFDLGLADQQGGASTQEAMMALESLGFKKEAISKALGKCEGEDTQSLIKQALKILAK